MSLLRIDASIRTTGSHSRELADHVEREWRDSWPGDEISRREIGTRPLSSEAWSLAVSAADVPYRERSHEQRAAVALAAELADELTLASALVFAVPLYNFGVSQHFKTYVDLVLTDARMAGGVAPPTRDTPALLITTRGGSYRGGVPRSGWDHSTSWIRHILEDAWQLDLLVLEADAAHTGVDAARDRCRQLGGTLRNWADGEVRVRDRTLAAPLAGGAGTPRAQRGRRGHVR